MKIYSRLIGLALLITSSTAFSIPLATVGGADVLVDWDNLSNSGTSSETHFVADYLGVSPSSISYTQLSGSGGSSWMQVDEDSSLWAFDFGSLAPALFIVKTGAHVGVAGESGSYTHYLFENHGNLGFGVIDLDLFTRKRGSIEIAMVSHVGISGTSDVPEPSAIALMSMGLLSFGFIGRKRRNPQR